MGRNSKARRDAKTKAKAKAAGRGTSARPSTPFGASQCPCGCGDPFEAPRLSASQRADALVDEAVVALVNGVVERFEECLAKLVPAGGSAADRRVGDRALWRATEVVVAALWKFGWRPADVVRQVARQRGDLHARLAADAIGAELRRYASTTIDGLWRDQVAESEARAWWSTDDAYSQERARREGISAVQLAGARLELLHELRRFPQLQVLGPRPGEARPSARSASAADPRVLDRVRKLLAKAESTQFAAEAETFTAGAQALMARHSIDHALLEMHVVDGSERPSGIRIAVDSPYEAPKALLLQAVAEANRCRAVWAKELGFSTVVGFPADLAVLEVLFTSLLVQATAELMRAGAAASAGASARSRSFRASFLTSYATRIGERLREAAQDVTDEAVATAADERLLPVLAARADAVDEAIDEYFPEMGQSKSFAHHPEGWHQGRSAAERAALGARTQVQA